MNRTLVFAVVTIAILAVAGVLRWRDQPYISYAQGARAEALSGLEDKGRSGDGFAAFLAAETYRMGTAGPADPEAARRWYLIAARSGELRAVTPYVDLALRESSSQERCGRAIPLLDLAARAGDPIAAIKLGQAHEQGRCVTRDLVAAAGYFRGAERVDRRLGEFLDLALRQLPPDQADAIRPIPAEFDVAPKDALDRFLADAPELGPP